VISLDEDIVSFIDRNADNLSSGHGALNPVVLALRAQQNSFHARGKFFRALLPIQVPLTNQ
jgi:hypothetical protein